MWELSFESIGHALTLATAWLSVLGYLAAEWFRYARRTYTAARWCWSGGAVVLAIHLLCAMYFVHGWSLAAAEADTARQTEEVFGVRAGQGVYANFVFVLLWLADAAWWWKNQAGYLVRPKWITVSMEMFAAVMFFNAAVVFAEGTLRWLSAGAMLIVFIAIGARVRAQRWP